MIQSAEEFAFDIASHWHIAGFENNVAQWIISRDKAIIETCKEVISKLQDDYWVTDSYEAGRDDSARILNSVLSELSGETP
jgi:hypothetical protein